MEDQHCEQYQSDDKMNLPPSMPVQSQEGFLNIPAIFDPFFLSGYQDKFHKEPNTDDGHHQEKHENV